MGEGLIVEVKDKGQQLDVDWKLLIECFAFLDSQEVGDALMDDDIKMNRCPPHTLYDKRDTLLLTIRRSFDQRGWEPVYSHDGVAINPRTKGERDE